MTQEDLYDNGFVLDRPHVMVVDDDEDILMFLEATLSVEFRITVINGGMDVADKIKENRPNILLLDYKMPGMSGLEVCKQLREDPANDIMPIVFLTAVDSEQLRIQGYRNGADDFLHKPFEPAELKAKLHVWTRLAKRSGELIKQNRELEEMTLRDGLTGLYSRRYVLEVLNREIAHYRRYDNPLSIFMIDIDDFKQINDNFGHTAGDEALRSASLFLRESLRQTDVAARYGGDEFVIVLPNTDAESAEVLCRRLFERKVTCTISNDLSFSLSFSVGIATMGGNIKTSTQLIDAADLAMLKVKRDGKGGFLRGDDDKLDVEEFKNLSIASSIRGSVRENVCRVIGSLVAEIEREGDVCGGRLDIMLEIGERIAERLQLSYSERQTMRNVILLCTCERLGLAAEVATRRGGMDEELRKVLAETMNRNLKLLNDTGILDRECEVLRSIHEWYNGNGFPEGRRDTDIPLLSRIIGMISAYAVLREGGAHTNLHEHEEALEILQSDAGTHFDPDLMKVMEDVLGNYYSDKHDSSEGNILLVDDQFLLCSVLSRRLTWAGFDIDAVSSMKEAKGILLDIKWRAILLDITLPDGNGLDLCRQIRNEPDFAEVPVIVISCRSDEKSIENSRKAGATAYVVKPVRFESLLRILAKYEKHVPDMAQIPVVKS